MPPSLPKRPLVALGAFALVSCAHSPALAASHGSAHGQMAMTPGAPNLWTSAWAGTPIPSPSGWTHTFTDSFNGGGTCPDIVNVPFATDSNPAHKFYATAGGSTGGVAGSIWQGQGAANPPISCTSGHLKLTASNPTGSQWQGALIQTSPFAIGATASTPNNGLVQQYGLLKVVMSIPAFPTNGVPWASFWLQARYSTAKPTAYVELDHCESGLGSGNNDPGWINTVHQWPASSPVTGDGVPFHVFQQVKYECLIDDGAQHEYDILLTHDWMIEGIDGVETQRYPMLTDNMRQAMQMEIDITYYYTPGSTSVSNTLDVYSADAYAAPSGCMTNGGCRPGIDD